MKVELRLTDYQLQAVEGLIGAGGPATLEALAEAAVERERERVADPRRGHPRAPRRLPPPCPADARLDAILPAASGGALRLSAGQRLRLVALKDGQCVDLRAFEPGGRTFSAARTRAIHGINPSAGASLWSTPPETPLLMIIADSAPSHDLCFPPCSEGEYARHAGLPGHLGCAELHARALDAQDGLDVPGGDEVLNLWLPSAVDPTGSLRSWPAACRRGDYVELEAHMQLVVTLSTCPDDLFGSSQYEPGPVRVIVTGGPPGSPVARGWPLEPPSSALASNVLTVGVSSQALAQLDRIAAEEWLGTARASVLRALVLRLHEAIVTGPR